MSWLSTGGGGRQIGFAALAVAVLVLAFLSKPIWRSSDHSYTGADLTQGLALTSLGEQRWVENALLGDSAVQFQPWIRYSSERVRAGELPLWNPHNGAGVPLFGNLQSGVLSPFNLPHYFLSFKLALLASAGLKLLCAGLFTFLFLRELGLSFAPALLGAIAFAFSGQMVIFLPNSNSSVIALLPAALFFIERAVRAVELARGRGAIAIALAGMCVSLALGIYAGHPEVFAWSLLLAIAYALGRLVFAWRRLGGGSRGLGSIAPLALAFLLAGVLSAALAAPQVLTFLEYLQQSVSGAHREPLLQPSLLDEWPLMLFPDAVGSPRPAFLISLDLPAPNYLQVNGGYVGGLVLLLAVTALLRVPRDRFVHFFAGAAVLWVALTCNLFELGRLYDASLLGSHVVLSRSQPVWVLSTSVLAALGFEQLISRPAKPRLDLAILAGGALVLLACWWGAGEWLQHAIAQAPDQLRDRVSRHIRASNLWIAFWFTAGALALFALPFARKHLVRAGLACLVLGAVFAQNGWTLRHYNSTIPDRFVYPRTEAMRMLQQEVGDRRLVVLGDNGIPPSTNLMYGLSTLQNYDALSISRYEQLFAQFFDPWSSWRVVQHVSHAAMQLFGAEYLLTVGDWVPIDTGLGAQQLVRGTVYRPIELVKGAVVGQTFQPDRNGMDAVAVLAGTLVTRGEGSSDLVLRLVDVERGERIAERALGAAELRERAFGPEELVLTWQPFDFPLPWLGTHAILTFAPIPDSSGRSFRLELESRTATASDPVLLWNAPKLAVPGAALAVDGQGRDGALLFDCSFGRGDFQQVARTGSHSLHRFVPALGPFFVVSSALRSSGRQRALIALTRPTFDPYRVVVLQSPDGPELPDDGSPLDEAALSSGPPATRVEVLERSASRVVLRAERTEPGWLVACQPWYPGWRATVGGVETPIEIANLAFCAVPVPAGTSEIVLEYCPFSFRLGVWIAAAGALLGIAGVLAFVRSSSASAPR